MAMSPIQKGGGMVLGVLRAEHPLSTVVPQDLFLECTFRLPDCDFCVERLKPVSDTAIHPAQAPVALTHRPGYPSGRFLLIMYPA